MECNVDTDCMVGQFWDKQSEWSQSVFGTDAERGPVGALKHLSKEVAETLEDPTDVYEYADMLFLLFDSARRAGFSLKDLMWAAFAKLEINKGREWNRPTSDEPAEHIR